MIKKFLASIALVLTLLLSGSALAAPTATADGTLIDRHVGFNAAIRAFKLALTYTSDNAAQAAYKEKCRMFGAGCNTLPTNFMYFNTVLVEWRIYNGVAWASATAPATVLPTTLQDAYNAGKRIDISAAKGPMKIADGRPAGNDESLHVLRQDGTGPALLLESDGGSGPLLNLTSSSALITDVSADNWSVTNAGVLSSNGFNLKQGLNTLYRWTYNAVYSRFGTVDSSFRYFQTVTYPSSSFSSTRAGAEAGVSEGRVGVNKDTSIGGMLFDDSTDEVATIMIDPPMWRDETKTACAQLIVATADATLGHKSLWIIKDGRIDTSLDVSNTDAATDYGLNQAEIQAGLTPYDVQWSTANCSSPAGCGSCDIPIGNGGKGSLTDPNTPIFLSVRRDADASGDTVTGDVMLIGVRIFYVRKYLD